MVNVKATIQIVSKFGYLHPFLLEKSTEYLGTTFLHAKLESMRAIRKLARTMDFNYANIEIKSKEKIDFSIMKIKREDGEIYVTTFQSCLFKLPQQ